MPPVPQKAVRGMKDLLPGEVETWQAIEADARSVAEGFGFAEIRTPLVEAADLFLRSIGEIGRASCRERV